MLSKTTLAFLFMFVLFSHGSASAENNWYVEGFGGVTFLDDATNESAVGPDVDVEFSTGWNAGGALGYDWGRFRAEFELTYSESDVDKLKILGVIIPSSGDASALAYLFNVFYDLENSTSITPYIGGGIGAATISANNIISPGLINVDDDDTVFAYKFAVGAAWKMTSMLDLTMDYNLFGTSDPEFTNTVTGVKFDSEIRSHNINGGIRFNF